MSLANHNWNEPSRILIRTSISLQKIESLIWEAVRDLDVSHTLTEGLLSGWLLTLRVNDEIKINHEGLSWHISLPLSVELRKKNKLFRFEQMFQGDMQMELSSKLSLSEDWMLTSNTTLKDFRWLGKPILTLGKYDVGMERITTWILKISKSKLCEQIDARIRSERVIREKMEELWTRLQQPFPEPRTGLSLHLDPFRVEYNQFVVEEGNLSSDVCLETCMRLEGKMDLAQAPSKPLPDLMLRNEINTESFLSLPIRLSFADLNRLLEDLVPEQEVTVMGRKLTFYRYEVDAENKDRLILKVGFKGFFRGDVWISGVPAYDAGSNGITLENPELKLISKNIVAQLLFMASRSRVISTINKELKGIVGKALEQIKSEINDISMDPKLYEGFIPQARIRDLRFVEASRTIEGFQVLLHADADISLNDDATLQ